MGEKLKEIYKVTTKKAGFIGRMKLAEKTGIPSVMATEIIGKNIDELLKK